MSSLGADILHKHGEFEFATPRRGSAAASPGYRESIVSDEAMLKLMDTVRKQIKLFETTTQGYKSLISALMARLKEMKGGSGGGGNDELRKELAQLERDRDNALGEVADLKRLLAEQNRQLSVAAKSRLRELKDLETVNQQLLADVRAANAAESAANDAKAAAVDEQKKAAAQVVQLTNQVKELEGTNRKLSAELRIALEAAKSGAAAAAPPQPRRAASKSTLADGSRDLESINRKLAAELRTALNGEAKANEARVVAENKIESMRIEMGSMIKAARQASNGNIPASASAAAREADGAEIKRLKEEVASEKQQVALLRKQMEADLERVSEVKKLEEQLQVEKLLTTGLRKELSDRNKEALAIKAENGESRRAKEELQAERQLTGQLRRDLAERSKELQLLTQEAGDVRKLKEDLAAERKLSGELRKELAERNKLALAGKAATIANAGRPQPLVLDSATEWQRMNDAELRSRLQIMSETAKAARTETVARESEIDRLGAEVTNLNKLVSNKDKTIADLTLKLSSAYSTSGPAGSKQLDAHLETLEAKHNKLDSDMELMEENLTLQANLAEKDEIIDKLRKQLKESKK